VIEITVLILLSMAAPVEGQPSLQNAILTDQSFSVRRQARGGGFADVKGVEAGPVRFSLSASYSIEFNDNVNTSENDPEGDVIQTPSVNLVVDAHVSERSDLTFQVGIGYEVFWHNEDLSRLSIWPGSQLVYDVQVKNLFLTLFDRVSYTEDTTTVPDLADQAQFPVFINTIGVQGTWLPNDFLIIGGYSYQIYLATSDNFDYVNRGSHLPYLRAGYVFAEEASSSGLEFSVTLTDYESSANLDSGIVTFGPYLDWRLTDAFRANLRGGFTYAANSLTILPEETFSGDSYYLGLDLDHALTDHISQHLKLSRGIRPSLEEGATFTEETTFNYLASWVIRDPVALGLDLNYIYGRQSVAAGVNPSEDYSQWRIGLNLSYAVSARLSSRLAYHYATRQSNLANRSYAQNRVILKLSYAFE